MKHFLTPLIAGLLLSACSAAPQSSPSKGASAAVATPPSFDAASMDTLLSEAISSGAHIGVSALVFDEGRTVYKNAFGMADRERGYAADLDTVWRIYSMTKPITAALIMDLREDGLLDLDDPVSRYIPELAAMQVVSAGSDGTPVFTPQARPMTIKDLLLHRAGMGYGIFGDANPVESAYAKAGLFDPAETLDIKMQKLAKLPLLAQPGDGWYYSYSIDVLGRIAELVTGERLGDVMQSRLFSPLGMSETSFRVQPDQKARFASNYLLSAAGTYTVQDDSQTSGFLNENAYQSAGGGLVSTLGDFAKFAQMMLDGGVYEGTRILSAESTEMMTADQMDADDAFMMPWLGAATNASFGYGGSVQIKTDAAQAASSGKAAGQWGWGGAARTNFWIDPDNNAFGIIMLQYFGQEDPALHDSFQALAYQQTLNKTASAPD